MDRTGIFEKQQQQMMQVRRNSSSDGEFYGQNELKNEKFGWKWVKNRGKMPVNEPEVEKIDRK